MFGNGVFGCRVVCDEGQNLIKFDGQKQVWKSVIVFVFGNDIRGVGGLSYDVGEIKVLRSEGFVVLGVMLVIVCFFVGGVGCKMFRFFF